MLLTPAQTKQPGEQLLWEIDYADYIAGRTLDSAITASVTVSPAGITKVAQVISGTKLQVLVGGGTDGQTYRWRALATLIIGGLTHIVEDEVDTIVQEV